MGITDDIRAKLKEAELEQQFEQLAREAQELVEKGVAQAGDLAHERRDDVDGWLAKAEAEVNKRTESQHAEVLAKVRQGILAGLDKVATHRRPGGALPSGTDPEAGPEPEGGTGS